MSKIFDEINPVPASLVYDHLEIIPLDVGLTAIHENRDESVKAFRVKLGSYNVHVTSLRLRTFNSKGTKCYICGATATHFSIDRFLRGEGQSETPHLNLWGINHDGTELLFTHDHVLARGLGGADKMHNSLTCCTVCNLAKSKTEDPTNQR